MAEKQNKYAKEDLDTIKQSKSFKERRFLYVVGLCFVFVLITAFIFRIRFGAGGALSAGTIPAHFTVYDGLCCMEYSSNAALQAPPQNQTQEE